MSFNKRVITKGPQKQKSVSFLLNLTHEVLQKVQEILSDTGFQPFLSELAPVQLVSVSLPQLEDQ